MRPASRRALLKRLGAVAPSRGVRLASGLALAAAAVFVIVHVVQRSEPEPPPPPPPPRAAPQIIDPVLALPFGEGSANAATPAPERAGVGPVDELRAAFERAPDRRALYTQWRARPEADARYLAFRAARDCDLLLAGAAATQFDAPGGRGNQRAQRMAAAADRCQGFTVEPAAPEEMEKLLDQAAAAGLPAAQVALAAEKYARKPLAETVAVLRRALASGDPLAYDESRILLAMTRHQLEIAGLPPVTGAAIRRTDTRVVAIDLAGCLLGNPCGPSRGVVTIECGGDGLCRRDAEDWLLQMSNLGDDDKRAARLLAERIVDAFQRGAVDEIVRAPGAR